MADVVVPAAERLERASGMTGSIPDDFIPGELVSAAKLGRRILAGKCDEGFARSFFDFICQCSAVRHSVDRVALRFGDQYMRTLLRAKVLHVIGRVAFLCTGSVPATGLSGGFRTNFCICFQLESRYRSRHALGESAGTVCTACWGVSRGDVPGAPRQICVKCIQVMKFSSDYNSTARLPPAINVMFS